MNLGRISAKDQLYIQIGMLKRFKETNENHNLLYVPYMGWIKYI